MQVSPGRLLNSERSELKGSGGLASSVKVTDVYVAFNFACQAKLKSAVTGVELKATWAITSGTWAHGSNLSEPTLLFLR